MNYSKLYIAVQIYSCVKLYIAVQIYSCFFLPLMKISVHNGILEIDLALYGTKEEV